MRRSAPDPSVAPARGAGPPALRMPGGIPPSQAPRAGAGAISRLPPHPVSPRSAPGRAQVEYYAPWCGYCKQFAPQYVKVAKSLQGLALVAAVNCDDKANARLCRAANIQGFPTIKARAGSLGSWTARRP
jgi:thiol-disulfide isomerase/thioredoxin